jgi:hypothetical protein
MTSSDTLQVLGGMRTPPEVTRATQRGDLPQGRPNARHIKGDA